MHVHVHGRRDVESQLAVGVRRRVWCERRADTQQGEDGLARADRWRLHRPERVRRRGRGWRFRCTLVYQCGKPLCLHGPQHGSLGVGTCRIYSPGTISGEILFHLDLGVKGANSVSPLKEFDNQIFSRKIYAQRRRAAITRHRVREELLRERARGLSLRRLRLGGRDTTGSGKSVSATTMERN